ncbi:MAG: hypothetical protein HZA22_04605 [Nitrospirae bacterium]|nr:hypothetical protein [Nitrospirota bacterium]
MKTIKTTLYSDKATMSEAVEELEGILDEFTDQMALNRRSVIETKPAGDVGGWLITFELEMDETINAF